MTMPGVDGLLAAGLVHQRGHPADQLAHALRR